MPGRWKTELYGPYTISCTTARSHVDQRVAKEALGVRRIALLLGCGEAGSASCEAEERRVRAKPALSDRRMRPGGLAGDEGSAAPEASFSGSGATLRHRSSMPFAESWTHLHERKVRP